MYLLRFTSATKARNALGEAFDAALPTSLVLTDAVYDEDGDLVFERETVPGFWLLSPLADQPGEVATLGPAGVTMTGDEAILGARLDPVWAGMPSEPLAMAEPLEPEPEPVPDGPTLSDWRVALIQMGRFADVKAAVEAARDTGSVEGLIAWERFEYANNVYRAELLRLAPVFGFSEADIDESLTAAAQASQALRGA